MIWQAKSRREIELIEKQGRIDTTLEEFRNQITPPKDDLTWEIRELLECIHQHLFEQDLNVGKVRRHCGQRNNNISTRFRRAVGMSLRSYIETGRMAAAKELLGHRDLEIYLIAMAVGYGHQETFCRAFHRHAGCTASEWREMKGSRNNSLGMGHSVPDERSSAAPQQQSVRQLDGARA